MVSETERNHLIISWLTLSVAFAILLSRFNVLSAIAGVPISLSDFFSTLIISLVATGTGFVFHELAHKYVGQHHGAIAEFRMWEPGLALAILLPLFTPFFFAAPGAVWIYGPHITRKQNAHISIAGPLTNVAIALFFMGLLVFFPVSGFLATVFAVAVRINLLLAAFNMLPLPPLDGSKVITWNPLIWGLVFFPLVFLAFF